MDQDVTVHVFQVYLLQETTLKHVIEIIRFCQKNKKQFDFGCTFDMAVSVMQLEQTSISLGKN